MLDLNTLINKVEELFKKSVANAQTGVQGTGQLFGELTDMAQRSGANTVLNPGDFTPVGAQSLGMSAPLAYDIWYLFNDVNLVHHIDPTTDSITYVNENLRFLEEKLNGLKPIRSLTHGGLVALREGTVYAAEGDWANQGAYFIQVMPFELPQIDVDWAYDTDTPTGLSKSEYVGSMMFPSGQLGIMEVISMFQETSLEDPGFTLSEEEIPVSIGDPTMFPPMEHAGENICFGRKLIESSYLVVEAEKDRVELMSPVQISIDDYTQNIKPKSWTKIWIKKTDKFPVPGEFIGILVKPLSVPPHVWWFQESTPLLYSGNWVETQNLTSGVITQVTLEKDRTDNGIGEEYWVRVNGIEFIAYSSDFKRYTVNERVAVLKRWTTLEKASRSYTWKDQRDGNHPSKDNVSLEFVIIPITFYKET
jgi:hypothetical protein